MPYLIANAGTDVVNQFGIVPFSLRYKVYIGIEITHIAYCRHHVGLCLTGNFLAINDRLLAKLADKAVDTFCTVASRKRINAQWSLEQ